MNMLSLAELRDLREWLPPLRSPLNVVLIPGISLVPTLSAAGVVDLDRWADKRGEAPAFHLLREAIS